MSTTAPRSPAVRSVLYRAVPALLTCCLAFFCFGQLVENRLLLAFLTLASGFAVWQARELRTFYTGVWKTGVLRGAERRGQQMALVAVSLVFCALVLWALVSNLVDPLYGVSRYPYVPVVAAAAAVAVLLPAGVAAANSAAGYLASRRAFRACVLAAVFIAFFVIQVRVGSAVRKPPGWDAQTVLDSAAGLATGAAGNLDAWYFSSFPNNITLTLALARYFDVVMLFGVTDLMLAAVVLNCAVLTLGGVLTYLVARRVGGEAVAVLTLVPSAVFLLLSPWIMVAYSDTLGLLFPVLLLYLYLVQSGLESPLKKSLIQVAMGITAVIGYNIKPTVILVLLAVAAVTLLGFAGGKPTKRRLLAAFTGTALVAGSYAGGSYALAAVTNSSTAVTFDVKNNDQAFPVAHYLKMGAQATEGDFNPSYGSWSGPDVTETASLPPGERTEQNLHSYLDRVREMGTAGYVSFLITKLTWFLGDGSFFAWGEGTVAGQPFVADDPLSRQIQSYYGFGNTNYGTLLGLWQAAWFVLLGLVSLPLFLARRALFTRSATIMRVALLGLFVFLLLFEARSRYLYLYLPFFIVLASLSASVLSAGRTGSAAAGAGLNRPAARHSRLRPGTAPDPGPRIRPIGSRP